MTLLNDLLKYKTKVNNINVIGSAPFQGVYPDSGLNICVNGSLKCVSYCNILLLTDQILISNRRNNRASRQNLVNQKVDIVLCVNKNLSRSKVIELLDNLGLEYRSLYLISGILRGLIFFLATKHRHSFKVGSDKPSNGIFAICIALFVQKILKLETENLCIFGINPLSTGHAFGTENARRSHVTTDTQILNIWKLKGKIVNHYV